MVLIWRSQCWNLLTHEIDVISVIDLKVVHKCKRRVCKIFISSWREKVTSREHFLVCLLSVNSGL
jgi:hypothetical protein